MISSIGNGVQQADAPLQYQRLNHIRHRFPQLEWEPMIDRILCRAVGIHTHNIQVRGGGFRVGQRSRDLQPSFKEAVQLRRPKQPAQGELAASTKCGAGVICPLERVSTTKLRQVPTHSRASISECHVRWRDSEL